MFWQEVNRRDKDLITKIYQILIIVKTKCWEKISENSTPQWDRISKNIQTSVKTRIQLSRKHRPLETKYIVIHVSERGTREEHGPTDSHKSHCYSRAFGVFLEILKDNNWTCSEPGRPSKQSIGLFCSGTSNWFHRNLPFHKSGDWWWKYCFQALGLLARRCVRFGWNFILEIWSLAYALTMFQGYNCRLDKRHFEWFACQDFQAKECNGKSSWNPD